MLDQLWDCTRSISSRRTANDSGPATTIAFPVEYTNTGEASSRQPSEFGPLSTRLVNCFGLIRLSGSDLPRRKLQGCTGPRRTSSPPPYLQALIAKIRPIKCIKVTTSNPPVGCGLLHPKPVRQAALSRVNVVSSRGSNKKQKKTIKKLYSSSHTRPFAQSCLPPPGFR